MNEFAMRITGNIPVSKPIPTAWKSTKIVFADVGARGGPPQNWIIIKQLLSTKHWVPKPEPKLCISQNSAQVRRFWNQTMNSSKTWRMEIFMR
jgi:hypothetical protein